MELNEIKKGDRIELHPATDLWMRGARYGDVTSIGRGKVSVKLDRIAHVLRVLPANILKIVTTGTYAGMILLNVFSSSAEARGGGHAHGSHHQTSAAHHSLNHSVRHMFGGK